MPATFDMPREALSDYVGCSPRPADFDAYWQAGLDEMHALGTGCTRRPADLRVSFAHAEDLYFTGVGGARVHARVVRPAHVEGPGPALLLFHPYARSAGDWFDLLPYAAAGITVAALDVRGQGGRSTDPGGIVGNTLRGHIVRGLDDAPEKLFYRGVYLDCAQLARVVMAFDEVDPDRVAAMGMSQGGGLTLACAALEPRVRFAVPIAPFLSDYLRVWRIDLARDGYAQLQEYFRRFDPLHAREAEVFERLGYIDVQHLCPRVEAEVLMVTGLMDTVCPPSTQFAAYNRLRGEREVLIYPDFAHEIPLGLRDLLFERICARLGVAGIPTATPAC